VSNEDGSREFGSNKLKSIAGTPKSKGLKRPSPVKVYSTFPNR
jgi:hypothetical protein